MHIAHLVCKFPPYRGGMGAVAFEEAARLSELGHEVTVFTLDQKEKLDPTKINFKIKYLKAFPRFGNGGFCPGLIRQLKGFDIIQLHYPFFGGQEVLWLGKKLGLIRAKLVIFYHMDASFDNPLVKLLSWPTKIIKNNLFKIADKIICASLDYVEHSSIKNIYKKYTEKFVEIPFGASQSPDRINCLLVEQIKQRLNWQADKKNILFIGGLDKAHYFKGVDVLIEAFRKLSDNGLSPYGGSPLTSQEKFKQKIGGRIADYKLLIVGDGDLRRDYEKQVQELNISDCVVFAGCVSDDELACYYYLADLVVLPSVTKAEAFGLVLAEAENFGKPVIGSGLPGVRGVVGEAGLLVRPGDIDDLAEKLKIILTDENLRQKFSLAGLRQVKEKYNWGEHTRKLEQLYKMSGKV